MLRFCQSRSSRSLSFRRCPCLLRRTPFGPKHEDHTEATGFKLWYQQTEVIYLCTIPHQFGVDTPGGCEAAVHSVRRYIGAIPQDHVVMKIDFTNAFNGIHRDEMLSSVLIRIPELYAYCRSSYGQPSFLFFGLYTVSSQECAQQGDPLGPLLFSNTIHPMLSSLQAELKLGYLDDITLGGPVEIVAFDVAEIMRIGAEIGLSLNVSKCELIAHSDAAISDTLLQSFNRVEIEDNTLLGAPLFPGPALDRALAERCQELAKQPTD